MIFIKGYIFKVGDLYFNLNLLSLKIFIYGLYGFNKFLLSLVIFFLLFF